MTARFACSCIALIAAIAMPGCGDECDSPAAPCGSSGSLTGRWAGTSTYINAPFTMDLQQSGTALTGQYRDQKDVGSVSGSAAGSSIQLDVNFGDTGMRMTGTVHTTTRITGEIVVPVLGNRSFSFEMSR